MTIFGEITPLRGDERDRLNWPKRTLDSRCASKVIEIAKRVKLSIVIEAIWNVCLAGAFASLALALFAIVSRKRKMSWANLIAFVLFCIVGLSAISVEVLNGMRHFNGG